MVWTQLPTFAGGCFTRYSPIPRSIAYQRARRQSALQLSSYMVHRTFSSKSHCQAICTILLGLVKKQPMKEAVHRELVCDHPCKRSLLSALLHLRGKSVDRKSLLP